MQTVQKINSQEAWLLLNSDKNAIMVDVRTPEEWSSVGMPDLSEIGKEVFFISWILFSDRRQNVDFVSDLQKVAKEKNAPLLFLCRSGGRSESAARCALDNGYTNCFNIIDGFEGNLMTDKGWRGNLLPIVQGGI
ncbi:MAG: rhodanese-like domain-containing protein [Rickettsiales bacterium]|nr:rhodanese-like domain-containing protein [Rickettsiales bacterium]